MCGGVHGFHIVCPSVFPKCPWFPLNNLSFNDPILLKFTWYLTSNKIQVEYEKEGYASIGPGVMAPDRREIANFWFPLNNLSFKECISLKFIWYKSIDKIQFEFEKEGYASIWTGVIAPDRSELWKIYGYAQ